MDERPLRTTADIDSAIGVTGVRNKVLSNTYRLLALTLAFSAIMAGTSMAIGAPNLGFFVNIIAMFGLLFFVHKTADSGMGLVAIFAFTGFMGFTLGPMLSAVMSFANGGAMVMQALGGTALIFFSLSAYVLTSRKDFSFLGGFLFIGMLVVIGGMIVNYFLAIPAAQLAISAAVIMIMSGLILFDTSRIIHGGETNYIRATVSLYLNIYNIFIHLLHLIMMFSGGDD